MNIETETYIENSQAAYDPFALDSSKAPVNDWSTEQNTSLDIAVTKHMIEQSGFAISFNWPTYFQTRRSEVICSISDIQRAKNAAAIRLLRSWREGDKQEQRETLEYLKYALDEDRLSDRKLFP